MTKRHREENDEFLKKRKGNYLGNYNQYNFIEAMGKIRTERSFAVKHLQTKATPDY